MDRIHAMSVFVKVVEHGSFARAAERLQMSTSACSRHVAQLERHLDARLLNRTTRRISLTESGQAFYERCVQLLADLQEAEQSASSTTARPRGTLRLTCSINFGVRHLAPALSAFLARHPEVKFDVSLSDRTVDLIEEGYDLAIRIGSLGSENLITRRLGETKLVVCASPAYLKKHGTPKRPEDLARHNCLTYEYGTSRHQWVFTDKRGRERSVKVSGTLHANNGDLLAAAAVQGIGITLEPDFVSAADVKAGRLSVLLPQYSARTAIIHAVYPSRRHLSAKVRSFVDFLAERFRRAG